MLNVIYSFLLFIGLLASLSGFAQTPCPTATFTYPQTNFSQKDTSQYLPHLLGMTSQSGQWSILPAGTIGEWGSLKPSTLLPGSYTITNQVSVSGCVASFSALVSITAKQSALNRPATAALDNGVGNSYGEPPVTVQSPNVASLGRFGAIEVSPFTGKPNIAVPLTSLSNEALSLPVSLNYDATGVRPDSHPGVVGLNWSLNAGGVISRTVKGFPDDWIGAYSVLRVSGFLDNRLANGDSYPADWSSATSIKTIASQAYFPTPNGLILDGQPDQYSFSVMGYSGSFYPYYEANILKWGVRCDQNIKVELVNNGGIMYPPFTPRDVNNGYSRWTSAYMVNGQPHYEPHLIGFRLTDEQGIVYEFNGSVSNSVEYSISFFDQAADTWLPTAWHLTSVRHPNGQQIDLTYNRNDFVAQLYQVVAASAETVGNLVSPSIFSPLNGSRCSTASSSGELPFSDKGDFIDGKLLSPVYINTIISANSSLSFAYANTSELGYESVFLQSKFDYLLTHDWRTGATGTYTPDLFWSYLFQSFYPNFNYSAMQGEITTNIAYYLGQLHWKKLTQVQLTSRDGSFQKKWVMSYTDNAAERLRLDQVQEVAADGTTLPPFSFTYSAPVGYSLPGYLRTHTDHWGFNNNRSLTIGTSGGLDYSQFNVTTYANKRAPATDINDMLLGSMSRMRYPTGGYTEFTFEPNTYSRAVNLARNGLDNVSGSGAGLRIAQLRDYDTNGGVVTRTYDYISSGILSSQPTYYWPNYYAELEDGDPYSMRRFASTSLIPQYENAEGVQIGYSIVSESRSGQGNTVYVYSNFDDSPDEAPAGALNQANTVFRPFSSNTLKRGKLVTLNHYNQGGALVARSTYRYAIQGTFQGANLTSFVKIIDASARQYCTSAQTLFEGSAYKVFTYKFLPVEELVTNYNESDANQSIFSSKRYSYKPNGQINEVITLGEFASTNPVSLSYNGPIPVGPYYYTKELRIGYTYPNDYPTDATLTGMTARNMIGYPVETTVRMLTPTGSQVAYTPLRQERRTYTLVNNDSFYQPTKVEVKFGTNDWQTPLEYLSYDAQGHVTSFRQWGVGKHYLSYFDASSPGKVGLLQQHSQDDGSNSLALQLLQRVQYNYSPLRGLSQMTTPSGLINTFGYDGFGRLVNSKDHNGHLVAAYGYHYGATATDKNAVISRQATLATTSETDLTDPLKARTSLQYLDGLGRRLQTVGYQLGPERTDIVLDGVTYDAFGRMSRQYLPVPTSSNSGDYQADLLTLGTQFYGDSHAYSEVTAYDISPLDRPREQYGPGDTWRNASRRQQLFDEMPGDDVRRYTADIEGNISTANNFIYPIYSLTSSRIVDEQNNTRTILKNRRGNIVQSRQPSSSGELITQYVYDELDRLAAVIQPEGYNVNQSMAVGSAAYESFVFAYLYDERGRVRRKHLPNGGWINYVYDRANRVVLEQNARQSSQNHWTFTKYDVFGRVVIGGELTNSSTQANLQTQFNGVSTPYEVWSSNTASYSSQSFPISYGSNDEKNYRYYDDYAWLPTGMTFDASNAFQARHSDAKGLETGGKTRNLETNTWLVSAQYYDTKGRVVQSFAQNNLSGIDRTDYAYQFSGELLQRRLTHQGLVESTSYTYDQAGRKTSIDHSINGATAQRLATYRYDGVGRLTSKDLGGSGSSASNYTNSQPLQSGTQQVAQQFIEFVPGTGLNQNQPADNNQFWDFRIGSGALQSQTYSWHIRGGLRGINLDNGGNLQTGKLFSLKLTYEEDGQYYDGNIRSQTWLTRMDSQTRSYTYSYDAASRLLDAGYGGGQAAEDYSVHNLAYDQNGNLTSLIRHGKKSNGTFGIVDNLRYTYSTSSIKSNQVLQVIDDALDPAGFSDVTGGFDYSYWPDGSLRSDANKGITQIDYNYLGRPRLITFTGGQTIQFQYDGQGRKLRQVDREGTVMDYVDNLLYRSGTLQQMAHEEGRIVPDNGNYRYEWALQDHLGNLRVMLRDSNGVAAVVQEEGVGPWGENLPTLSYSRNTPAVDPYVFTGHERMAELGIYDAKARAYDPLVPRFWQVDPLSQQSEGWSPYAYGLNNPVSIIDPSGMSAQTYTGHAAQQLFSELQERMGIKPPTELLFDQNGKFLQSVGKGGLYTGVVVDSKGNIINRFDFNDQNDAKAFLGSDPKLNRIDLKFDNNINNFLDEGDVKESSILTRYFIAGVQSLAGNDMDFLKYIAASSGDDKTLYLAGDKAYNNYDAGNFLWGAAMHRMGFDYGSVKVGSEMNGFINSKRQNGISTPWYTFWKGVTLGGDAVEDQRAILNGFFWSPGMHSNNFRTQPASRSFYPYYPNSH